MTPAVHHPALLAILLTVHGALAGPPPEARTRSQEILAALRSLAHTATGAEIISPSGPNSSHALRVCEGDRVEARRHGVVLHAPHPANASAEVSAQVVLGFAGWLLSADSDAVWMRQHAETYLFPLGDASSPQLVTHTLKSEQRLAILIEVRPAQVSSPSALHDTRGNFSVSSTPDLPNGQIWRVTLPPPSSGHVSTWQTLGKNLAIQASRHLQQLTASL